VQEEGAPIVQLPVANRHSTHKLSQVIFDWALFVKLQCWINDVMAVVSAIVWPLARFDYL
jgi:hypothetical protein